MNSSSRDHAHSITGATRDLVARAAPARGICADNHEQLLAMVAEGLTGAEIAARLGTTRSAVLGHCHRHGVKLPLTPRKHAMRRERRRRGPGCLGGVVRGKVKFPPGHAARRRRSWGTRAFTDQEIATAIARHLAGMSGARAAKSIGASWQSLRKWEHMPDLVAMGDVLFARARAAAAVEAAARAEKAERDAAEKRALVDEINAPILAGMPARHRAIMERRINGVTLQGIGDDFGVSRERVRQIEVRWRLQGLVIPDARPLNPEAAKRLMIALHLNPDGSQRVRTKRFKGPKKTGAGAKSATYWAAKVDAAFAGGAR